MAPIRKRGRPQAHDSDDEEIIDVSQASSNLRQELRKKARLSTAAQTGRMGKSRNRQRSDSPEDANTEQPQRVHEHVPPPSTQYEIDRDAGFAHLNHADVDDERATQRLIARKNIIGENRALDNAIIESVTMVNFMCHERLHVKLGPLINFIVGKNGSGKSAILTAITLCLGGKASTTNRGGSLKSFIKEGRDQGSLTIHLKNQGQDAYQPDVYGKTIIVERSFSKTGSSGFKLKSASGRIISTKKSDVEDVIEYFQMQIDNPMTVLSQDNARGFVTNATPAQKYKFFVKGVQLEQLDNDYKLLGETTENIELKLDGSKEHIQKLKQDMNAAKEKLDLVNKHKDLRQESRKLGRQSAWAQVEEQEQELNKRAEDLQTEEDRVQELQRQIDAKENEFNATNDAIISSEDDIAHLQGELTPVDDELSETKSLYDAANQDVQNAHQEQRAIRELLKEADNTVKKISAEVEEEQRRLENANGGAHAQKLTDFNTATEKVEEIKNLIERSDVEEPKLLQDHEGAIEEAKKSEIAIEKKKKEIKVCETQLQNLRRDAGSVMSGFDPKMPRLLELIRKDKGFLEKPVGPIGLHIKLLKPIWANILERSIGNVLSGFVVTSKHDQLHLSSLIRRVGLENVQVLIGNNHSIDTRGHEPDESYDTVLRVLEIDNDLVRRQLIINQGIEQVILIENRQNAMRTMYEGNRPQNVKQCFCLHDSRRGWGLRLGYMPGTGDPSSSPIMPTNQKPRMKGDSDSQISYQEETLGHVRGELKDMQLRQRELQQGVQKRSQAVSQHRRNHEQHKLKLQRAEDNQERLQEELDGDNIEDGRLEALKADLQDAQTSRDIHGGSYGASDLDKAKKNEICIVHKRKLEEIKTRMASHEKLIEKARKKLSRVQAARQIVLQEKNLVYKRHNEAKIVRDDAKVKVDRQRGRVETFIAGASDICARIPVDPGETPASIDAKLNVLQKTLDQYSKRAGGTDEEINQKYEAAVRRHSEYVKSRKDILNLHAALKKAFQNRLNMWRQFQRHISARSRTNFTYLLSERGFRGRLIIDHQQKLLDIHVEPDTTLESAAGRNTKTLSGGEKSFSNTCMLLSVWEAMSAPLRCLDEFDVFMDNVNRDVSTAMIIQAARRSVGRQFILISPHGIGPTVKTGADVVVTQMSAPDQIQLPAMANVAAHNS